MHFQIGDGMAKLVRCSTGTILDVLVDLRRGSPTFGEWEAFRLDDENLHQLYCPVGFAHGFCVLSYNDPEGGIDWPPDLELIPSARDSSAPTLREIESELPFTYAG